MKDKQINMLPLKIGRGEMTNEKSKAFRKKIWCKKILLRGNRIPYHCEANDLKGVQRKKKKLW